MVEKMYEKIENAFVTDGEDDTCIIEAMTDALKSLGWRADWDGDGDKFIVAPKKEFYKTGDVLEARRTKEVSE